MGTLLQPAGVSHAAALVALRNAVASDLAARHGEGHWSHVTAQEEEIWQLERDKTFIVEEAGALIATLTLIVGRTPFWMNEALFPARAQPIYLHAMAVTPDRQRSGLGRACVIDAARIAREWGADEIRLDAYDAPAGAGGFYARCGYREVARASYRDVPLIYYAAAL